MGNENGPILNEDILNDIWEHATLEYQNRIPLATQGNLKETLAAMLAYSPSWNEFQHHLINRVGSLIVRDMVWKNPLAEFKNPAMVYGHTIEEVKGGLIKAREYSPDADSLGAEVWGQERLEIKTAFHSRNRTNKYKITLSDHELKQAVVNEGELNRLVTMQMSAMQTSDQWDEFLVTCRLFEEYDANNGFHRIQVPNAAALTSTAADAKMALRIMKATTDELKFLSSEYNPMGMPAFANPDDLVMFVSTDFKAAMDVEALAAAFNLEYLETSGRLVVLPRNAVKIKGFQAILTTKHFLIIADTLVENRSIQNPDGLYTNFWFHHHSINSVSLFEPAVLLTSEAVAARSVESYPVTSVASPVVYDGDTVVTTVQRGSAYLAMADVTTTPASDTNQGVGFTLTGNEDNRTTVNQYGILHVSPWETSNTLSIIAESTWINPDDAQGERVTSLARTLTVAGELAPAWPSKVEAAPVVP